MFRISSLEVKLLSLTALSLAFGDENGRTGEWISLPTLLQGLCLVRRVSALEKLDGLHLVSDR